MKVVEGRMYCFVKEVVYGEVKASYFKLRGERRLSIVAIWNAKNWRR